MSRIRQASLALALIPIGMLTLVLIVLVSLFGSQDRAWNAMVGLDQSLNALTGGSEDQTISGRAYEAQGKGKAWGCVLCKVLDWFEKGHCAKFKDS